MRKVLLGAVAAGAVALSAGSAHAGYYAGTFSFSVVEGNTSGNGFNAVRGATPFTGGTANAAFTYTGTLNFDNTAAQNAGNTGDLDSTWFASATNAGTPNYGISGYSGSGSYAAANANFSTEAGYLAASGSASGYQWGSFYTIDLGTLAAGTVITVTHDDGASIYQGSTQIGSTKVGPTTVYTDTVQLGATGDTTLYYSRQNGTPSILEVSVPEPASLGLLGLGALGAAFMRRRKSGGAAA
jgi:hypothetical protein